MKGIKTIYDVGAHEKVIKTIYVIRNTATTFISIAVAIGITAQGEVKYVPVFMNTFELPMMMVKSAIFFLFRQKVLLPLKRHNGSIRNLPYYKLSYRSLSRSSQP